MPNSVPNQFASELTRQTLFQATLWQVILTNGITIFRFTDHDRLLSFEVVSDIFVDFTPVGGFNASATQFNLGLSEHNKEFIGPVDARAIQGSPEDSAWPHNIVGPTYAQVRSGALRDAEVTEWVVDPRWPWAGYLQKNVYWLGDVEYDNETFRAQVEGIMRFANPKVGDVFARSCRHQLGRDKFGDISLTSGCRYDVNSATERGTINTILTQRKSFTETGLSTQSDGFWELGRVLWQSGANEGFVSQCSRWTESTNTMILIEDTPFNMTVGDTFDVEPGCNGTSDHCENKFGNKKNYGGQLDIPGNDFLLRVPRK